MSELNLYLSWTIGHRFWCTPNLMCNNAVLHIIARLLTFIILTYLFRLVSQASRPCCLKLETTENCSEYFTVKLIKL